MFPVYSVVAVWVVATLMNSPSADKFWMEGI